jgi:hypothetical protein
MNVFSFRAECQHDIDCLRESAAARGIELTIAISKLGVIDCAAEVETAADLDTLQELLACVPDSHVMLETLRPCRLGVNRLSRAGVDAERNRDNISSGDVGFYGPDPGSKHSPMVCLGHGEEADTLLVFEVPTECVVTIDRSAWMTQDHLEQRRAEVASGPRYAAGSDMADLRAPLLKGYERALAAAESVAGQVPQIVEDHAPSEPAPAWVGSVGPR